MIEVINQEQLIEDGARRPFVDTLIRSVTTGGSPLYVKKSGATDSRYQSDWIVVRSSEESGFAVHVGTLLPAKSQLRQRVNYLHVAQILASNFGTSDEHYQVTEETSAPADWIWYRVAMAEGRFLCAVSPQVPTLSFLGLQVAPRLQTVRVPLSIRGLISEVCRKQKYDKGDRIRVFYLSGFMEGNFEWMKVVSNEEGNMSIQIEQRDDSKVAESDSFGVRLDLGEVNLSLEMLSALRAGTTLELDAHFPMECFLSIGATTLAKGVVRPCEKGLEVEIVDLLA